MTGALRGPAIACAVAVILLGLLRFGGYLLEWDGGPDGLLFPDKLEREALATGHSNRMAPNTAAAMLLVGLALVLLKSRSRRAVLVAQVLALMTALIALVAFIGYAYSALNLAGIEAYIPMALNTAVAMGLMAAGILCGTTRSRTDGRGQRAGSRRRHGAAAAARGDRDPGGRGVAALARPAGWDVGPGDGAVAVRGGQHRDPRGPDLVECGVDRAHGPQAASGGAAPGHPERRDGGPGGIAPVRRRRVRGLECPLRRAGLAAGRDVVGQPAGRRPALRRGLAFADVPRGRVRGPEPANDHGPGRRPAGTRLGERPAGVDPGRRPATRISRGRRPRPASGCTGRSGSRSRSAATSWASWRSSAARSSSPTRRCSGCWPSSAARSASS